MALPAHLQRYDGLIDMIAQAIVRELERGTETKTPAAAHDRAGVISINEHRQHGKITPGLAAGATGPA